jgi:hypothetical protein
MLVVPQALVTNHTCGLTISKNFPFEDWGKTESETDKKSKNTKKETKKSQNELSPQDPCTNSNTPESGLRVGDFPPPLEPQPKDNECSAYTKSNFRVYSHNVQGL